MDNRNPLRSCEVSNRIVNVPTKKVEKPYKIIVDMHFSNTIEVRNMPEVTNTALIYIHKSHKVCEYDVNLLRQFQERCKPCPNLLSKKRS